jgi:hypothetical protein
VPPSRKRDLKALDKDLRDKIENKICEDEVLLWAGIALRHQSFRPLPTKSQSEENN